jgi:hypothetical protein
VIYAGPRWRLEVRSRETGIDRKADNHYRRWSCPTSRCCRSQLRRTPDCVLFLWATPPMLPQALDVAAACGFTSTAASCGARTGCKRAVVVDPQGARKKKRADEAARFNRKGAAAWRLVRLPSMLGALLEDSRSMPAPVGPAKRPAFY